MELYLIRHGQSFNNTLTDRKDRVCDPSLTELGCRQAELVAHHLATAPNLEDFVQAKVVPSTVVRNGYGITKLYCSPMHRALQTALPIGQALGLTPEVFINIHEIGGIFLHNETESVGLPGRNRPEILAEFPHYVLPAEIIAEHGWWGSKPKEDWPSCHGRAARVASQLLDWSITQPAERIALVTHGGFCGDLLKALFNQLPGRGISYYIDNTSITRLDFDLVKKRINLRYLNRLNHLPPELVS